MPTDPRKCESLNTRTGERCKLWKAKAYSEHYCIHHLNEDGPDGAAIQRELYNKKNKSLKVSRERIPAKRKVDRVAAKKDEAQPKKGFSEVVESIFRPRNFDLKEEYEIAKIERPGGTGEKDTELWVYALWSMADDVTREPKSRKEVAEILAVAYNTVRTWEHGSRFKRMSTRIIEDAIQHGAARQLFWMRVVEGMANGDNKMTEIYGKKVVDKEDGNEDPKRPFEVPEGLRKEADRLTNDATSMRATPALKKIRDAKVDDSLMAGDFKDDEQAN